MAIRIGGRLRRQGGALVFGPLLARSGASRAQAIDAARAALPDAARSSGVLKAVSAACKRAGQPAAGTLVFPNSADTYLALANGRRVGSDRVRGRSAREGQGGPLSGAHRGSGLIPGAFTVWCRQMALGDKSVSQGQAGWKPAGRA